MQYTVVVEESEAGYGAYVPNLPGCVAAGETREEVQQLIREAIELHIGDLKNSGHALPAPHSTGAIVEVQPE